jgi:hypothetical protein
VPRVVVGFARLQRLSQLQHKGSPDQSKPTHRADQHDEPLCNLSVRVMVFGELLLPHLDFRHLELKRLRGPRSPASSGKWSWSNGPDAVYAATMSTLNETRTQSGRADVVRGVLSLINQPVQVQRADEERGWR